MTLKNTASRYGMTARSFHWAMAVIIIALLLSGFFMGYLTDITQKIAVINWHKSFGVLALVLGLLRLLWRFISPPPPLPAEQSLIEKIAARSVHIILYILFLVQPTVGIFYSWTKGYPVIFFNIAPLPSLMSPDKELAGIMHTAHFFVGWGLVGVICVHVAAALKHHFIDKDDVLLRMLPARKKETN